jgi:SAM-dependent methyltransferase
MPAPKHADKVARQKAHFDSIAERYSESRQHANHLQLKHLIWTHFFAGARAAGFDPGDKIDVLEAMCGFADGKDILETHLKTKITYSGFDYSSAVVDKLDVERPDIRVWQQDVTQFSSDKQFDIVIVLGGLHHVPHAAADVTARLATAIRPGGYFINLEPTHGNPVFQAARERIYSRNPYFDEQTERAFVVKELFGFFEVAGLEKVHVTWPGLRSYVLYYNPDAFPSLNLGSQRMVRSLFALEKPFLQTRIARALSFATLSLWRRPA